MDDTVWVKQLSYGCFMTHIKLIGITTKPLIFLFILLHYFDIVDVRPFLGFLFIFLIIISLRVITLRIVRTLVCFNYKRQR